MAESMRWSEVRERVRQLELSAVGSGRLPQAAASYAARATLAAARRRETRVTKRSLAAYFEKVAARRTIRCHGTSEAAARMIADAVVADIVASGRSGQDAFDELVRGWGRVVPSDVLDHYRERLCA